MVLARTEFEKVLFVGRIQMAIFSLKLIFRNNTGFKGAVTRGNLFLQLAKNGFE